MNTTPDPQTLLRELSLQERYGSLSPAERSQLESLRREHPEAAREAREDRAFLEHFEDARVTPSHGAQKRLERSIVELSMRRRSEARRSAARRSEPLGQRLLQLLFGRPEATPRATLLLSRCVALYLGIAAAFVPWYFSRGDGADQARALHRDLAIEFSPASHPAAEKDFGMRRNDAPASRPR